MRAENHATPVLRVTALERHFGHKVIGPVEFELAPGERLLLLGPNGFGKSTILRCVAGTLTPTRGRVEVVGNPAGTLQARAAIGASFSQERSFDLRLRGSENLAFYARLRLETRREAQRSVEALVEELELEEIAPERVANCSSGMTQRLAFARALLGEPPLLVLDEPTRSLDHSSRSLLWAALDRRPRTAVLLATHLDEDANRTDRFLDLAG